MKNKLKITTALVGSLMAVGATSALAQNLTTYYDGGKDGTTVSGNMNISYRDQKTNNSPANNSVEGLHGFGKEVQININNRGKLNNGWGYAAGFSIEADGTESNYQTFKAAASGSGTGAAGGSVSGVFGENNFIDIIIGDTTLTLSNDHIQNPDANPTLMGGPSTYLKAYASAKGIYPEKINSPYEAMGIGIVQKTSIGSFSALYVPNEDAGSSNYALWGNDNGNSQYAADYNNNFGSAYEFGFVGGLSVPGLTTSAWYNHSQMPTNVTTGAAANYFGRHYGEKVTATYLIGSTGLTVAGEVAKNGVAAADASSGGAVLGKSVGLSYAVTKDFSIAGTYGVSTLQDAGGGTQASAAGANKKDEKIEIISAGYSLGPVALKGQYRKTINLAGNAANGAEQDFLLWSGVNF
jgi:hypothetical protein